MKVAAETATSWSERPSRNDRLALCGYDSVCVIATGGSWGRKGSGSEIDRKRSDERQEEGGKQVSRLFSATPALVHLRFPALFPLLSNALTLPSRRCLGTPRHSTPSL